MTNGSLKVLLIEHDPNVLGFLVNLIRQAGHTVLSAPSGKEGLIEAWRNRPDFIVIDGELADLPGVDVARKLRSDARTSQARIIMLSARANPEAILAGMQAGADEYLVKRAGVDAELMARLGNGNVAAPNGTAAQAASPTPAPTPPKGKLIAFLSAKGGTGTSSLCANMAQIMTAQVNGRSIAVVDLVLPIGSIGQIVGGDTPSTIIDLSRSDVAQLSPAALLQQFPITPGWGFHLIAGSPDPEAAQGLQVGRLDATFIALRQAFDFVFVDFGRSLSRISLPLIREATRVVLVLSPDHATVALSKITLKYLEIQGVRRNFIFPILNRAVGLDGMTKTEIEHELALNIPGMVPHLSGTFALANNSHRPVSYKMPNTSGAFALDALTTALLGQLSSNTAPLSAA